MAEMVARLDDLGRPAWIALMVVSFVLFWPVGLAVLAYLIWSGRMGCGRSAMAGEGPRGRWENRMSGMRDKCGGWGSRRRGFAATGNRAFDEYREEMLKRLEDEAQEFSSYLDRLRHAKDKAEFDQFMAERRNPPTADAGSNQNTTAPPRG